MNNDIKDLMLVKKEIINKWLEYLNFEDDDLVWTLNNKAFFKELYNIVCKLEKIESNDLIKKHRDLINTIGQYINNKDRLNVKKMVNKLKDLGDEKEMNDDNFNNIDQRISDIDNKLEQLKQEELESKTSEEQENIKKQWDELDVLVNNFTNSMLKSFKESKNKDAITENYKMEPFEKSESQISVSLDEEFERYCEKYEQRFGRKANISDLSRSKEIAIECIKKCLQEDRDILNYLYYVKFGKNMGNDVLDAAIKKESNDKFVWGEGDIKIAKTQCEFCKYNDKENSDKCSQFPNGKLSEVMNNKILCSKFESKNKILL